MRQGAEECTLALRLLRRLRKRYRPRFFDVVVADSWYANGPFLKTVVEGLGWPVVAVPKQERYEIYQEVLALTRGPKPARQVERDGRRVEIGELRTSLPLPLSKPTLKGQLRFHALHRRHHPRHILIRYGPPLGPRTVNIRKGPCSR